MLSYSCGHNEPLMEEPTDKVFQQAVRQFSHKDALIVRHQGKRLSYSDLDAAVQRTARGLVGLSIGQGDRIGVWSTNCVEWVLLHLACARIGAVLVNVNPAYRAYELRFVLGKSRIKALFLWEADQRSSCPL